MSNSIESNDSVSNDSIRSGRKSIQEDMMPQFDVSLYGWGDGTNGELGNGISEYITKPVKAHWKYEEKIKSVVCGVSHTLVITYEGRVYSCGNNDYGQLGHDKQNNKLHEVTGLASYHIVSAACGKYHSLVLDEWGQSFSWGRNSVGQLGLNIPLDTIQKVPKIIKELATKNVVQISCGYQHSLALTNDGILYAWGCNEYGQLGSNCGFSCVIASPIDALFGVPITRIVCGGYHSFCISKSGAVYGWGKNNSGQLGLNDTHDQIIPHQLCTLRSVNVKYIACGEEFSVFLTEDGGVFTCGSGMFGQLGHGSFVNEILPKKVVELMGSSVTQISCGRMHTLALVPSKSRVYASGIGSSDDDLLDTARITIPHVVQGPWLTDVEGPDYSDEEYSIKCLYSGGNRCFVTIARKKDNVEPDDFRCIAPKTQILTINEETLSDCLNLDLDKRVNLELISYFETVMGSVACFNASFWNEGILGDSSLTHNINMEQAIRCFNIISKLEHSSLKHTIIRSIAVMLISLPTIVIDEEILRVYIILPLYHEFMNPKNSPDLQLPFGKKLLNVTSIVDKWYRDTNSEYFELLVLIYKNVLIDQLRVAPYNPHNSAWDSNIIIPLDVLSMLNTINGSMVDGYKVPYNSFHIKELNEIVDIKADYVRWFLENNRFHYFCNYPFLFDAEAKTTLLQTDQILQMRSAINNATVQAMGFVLSNPHLTEFNQFLEIRVARANIVSDAIRELSMYNAHDLKKPLRVTFLGEEAEDAGGVRKEFFMLIFKEILDPKYGMFKLYEESGCIWFQPTTFEEDSMYFMIGLLCGLAIYNFTIVNLPFPLLLYKKILNEPLKFADLKDLSPVMYKNLNDILQYEGDDFDYVYGLNFIMIKEVFGQPLVLPLKPGGEDIIVTQKNKHEYVNLFVDMLLNKSVEKYFTPFKDGLLKVCGGRVLQLFRSQELMAVVIGNEDYDWYELENNAEYKKGYTSSSHTIRLFWEVFFELSLEDKKKFLLYLTGSDRIPIQGMKAIKIIIQPTSDERYLPVAHTCFNLLDLPKYRTKERLKYKLLQAIQQTHGFSLV